MTVQFIRGTRLGKALAGEVNSTSYGTQLALSFTPMLSRKLGYDHIAASPNGWSNGSLVIAVVLIADGVIGIIILRPPNDRLKTLAYPQSGKLNAFSCILIKCSGKQADN